MAQMVEPSNDPLFGPNSDLVNAFLEDVRRIDVDQARRLRQAWVARLGGAGASLAPAVAAEHARVFARGVRRAVQTGRRDAHTRATFAARVAFAVVGPEAAGVVHLVGDLAGLLVVRDLIDDEDFEFVNSVWREATGRDAG